ncbi:protein FAR1-RELATED SEQUENCE 5 [Sorghum bicolor]|uniref:protein FAR1-RELATED SEQUENCE 5 n=1 Tax=Sorghum bicolor TaxID=4558 RepID=UPI000B42501C|nr:protein FAR1-RELATED SEQUENCE 5 [Sorghum bicolor]|eukprot:XP_002437196.2 protein FAR1-RELATED SEQUENCE 5 [Sorghum bicolor]
MAGCSRWNRSVHSNPDGCKETTYCMVLGPRRDGLLPQASHLLASQRKISELQGFEIETADNAGIGPKAAHELASIQVGGSHNLSYTLRDHKNYLRAKRQREMAYGQAGSMLSYFQEKIAENPSFQYALQMDREEQIANIFWVDAKMLTDYAYFGDVVSFDTTFGTNKESRPFGVFLGFNHFRQTVVFGVVLMYDETFESFKWLFETFLNAHNGKQPKTIYTDQDAAMGKAVKEVFLEYWHGLCVFHIMQNAVRHLAERDDEESDTPPKRKKKDNKEEPKEPSILADFSACMYEYEDEETFQEAFNTLRRKANKQTWLDRLWKIKEDGSKEQETAKKGGKKKEKKVVVQEAATAPMQNIDPTTSLPVEEMSAPYMAINSFSQILIGAITNDVIADF